MPVDATVIEAQIKALGKLDTFGTKKEIRELPGIIAEGETILGMGSGMMDGNTWLITVTDRRVILLDKGLVFGLKQLELPLARIKSVTHKTGLMFGEILIDTGGDTKKVQNMMKADAPKLAGLISDLVHRANQGFEAQRRPSGEDTVSKLERLATLREKGILTDAEFQAEKTKILNG